MNKAAIIGIAVLIIIIASATHRFFEQRKQRVSDDNAPVKLYMVEIIDKKEVAANERRSRENDVNGPETTYYYQVTFRLTTDERKDLVLNIDKSSYLNIEPEMKGRLFMQGSRFVKFETDVPIDEQSKK
ncbi:MULTISPECIES: DUF2500 family protein [Proteus]|jgi:hypothetical protein|uniref:Protein of uncharacterized function (DUF2500) n=1 Tax=Proteus vulgaris TaxID=585 RepID=A0A379F7B2_PROVU|nr:MULTISPECIES: DUF2500 family protein [Proteus]KGA56326.1 hypothetical protein DR95_2041 [Proteus vulgaris]MBG5970678.1 DUF2500 domain-containing protein [Proteus vulgaris]MBG5986543.1 DUF2500 domain-containing protein [Proteus vulgaris]MBI6512810.1 DUF2500 domain-containing protein [Proteus sp. PR00174]MBW3470947.1 DUF2500 domain-containing protein [Proteus vulgaris]